MYLEQWTYPRAQQGDWTEERIATLKQLLAERMPPRAIAIHLGGVTKNAVIGKARRLGLAIRSNPQCREHLPKRGPKTHVIAGRITQNVTPRVRIAPTFPADPVVIHEDIYVAPENRKGVLALTEADCKWPIGDPREADFHFCGGPRVPGLPYCEGHCKRAYQTVQEVDARRLRAMKAA